MKNGKLIAGIAAGAVVALFLIPKTRKMITDAVSNLTDSLGNLACSAEEATDKAKKMASDLT
ncbi:MAG TPA: hypothetical protein PLY34_03180 [Ferruginibacter sp.]|nr:hypothetical protein [Ferruginibacter sp.]HPH92758.1 hypothetical protein [Ferruginibacter sp.]